jgi:thiol:disulfide interchange protein DsbD
MSKRIFFLLLLSVTLVLSGCRQGSKYEEVEQLPKHLPELRAEEINWTSSFHEAIKESKTSTRPLLVDFYTDWCGWCKEMDRVTYRDPKVIALSEKFVCVKVNCDTEPDLSKKYKIQGLPTVIILDKEGSEVSRIVGYCNAEELRSKMLKALMIVAESEVNF